MVYRFPEKMRPSTLKERERFYREEFRTDMALKWLSHRKIEKTAFAVIVGRHSGIYRKQFENIRKKAVIIDSHRDFADVLDHILYYLPEGVYYDRNIYADLTACDRCGKTYRDCWDCDGFLGQELAFDIDPENIDCPYHGNVGEKMKRGQGLSFCMIEFRRARKYCQMLYDELKGEYREVRIVYSGRGFHIHVLDERAARMSRDERIDISKQYRHYAIDEWVTNGEMRLIRLPYSLNGLVSRICIPLSPEELSDFDPRRMAIPSFLPSSPPRSSRASSLP